MPQSAAHPSIALIKKLLKKEHHHSVRRHTVITGTGRAGTTFLVELLTHLGLDTGYSPEAFSKIMNSHSKAGLEWDIRSADAPYVVKSPFFCDQAEEIIRNSSIILDHVFIPIRDLEAAAASRVRVVAEHPPTELKATQLDGGLWDTEKPGEQTQVLTRKIYSLLNALSDSFIPITLLSFPRIVNDPEYCHKKLHPLIGHIKYARFKRSFDAVSHPEWVHHFAP